MVEDLLPAHTRPWAMREVVFLLFSIEFSFSFEKVLDLSGMFANFEKLFQEYSGLFQSGARRARAGCCSAGLASRCLSQFQGFRASDCT